MECPNCTFQNAPGSPRCVRCQSVLQLAGVDVIPPRATPGWAGVVQRRTARSRREGARSMARFGASLRRPWMRELSVSALAWSILPGLGHVRHNQRHAGFVILAAWTLLLVSALLMIGSARSWLLIFAAISLHSLAFSLLLAPVLQRMPFVRRALAGMGLYLALLGMIYYPIYAVASRTFRVLPVAWIHDSGDLREGDVLLYTSDWTRPEIWRRGDLVVVRIDPLQSGGTVMRGGYAVDRIVGLPGDTVSFKNGELLVNGEAPPPEAMPLRGLAGIPEFRAAVARGQYVVIPTSLRWNTAAEHRAAVRAMVQKASRVPDSHLLGRAFWRARPLGRAGRL